MENVDNTANNLVEELRLGVHKRRHLGREWGSEMLRTASERRGGGCLVLIGERETKERPWGCGHSTILNRQHV